MKTLWNRSQTLPACATAVAAVALALPFPTRAQTTAASTQTASRAHVVLADSATSDALKNDPVLKALLTLNPVELIEALMPGINHSTRLLDPAQHAALEATQRRLKDEFGILSFVWIGRTDQIARATAENVRLVRDRTDGKQALVLLFTSDPTRQAALCSGPLVERLGGRDAAASFLRFDVAPESYATTPGAGIVTHTAGLLTRLAEAGGAKPPAAEGVKAKSSFIRQPGETHRTAETAPVAAPPEVETPLEPRLALIVALAASVGGLFVGLIVLLVQSRRRRGRARSIPESHFVVAAQAAAPVPSSRAPGVDYSQLAAAMPWKNASVEERLALAQTRLLALRESAQRLQETVNSSTVELLTHIEREIEELETLRRALQS